MTLIAGIAGQAVWPINANGSQGRLTLISGDNVTLSGSVTFEDTPRDDPIDGTWDDAAGHIRFTRHLPGGNSQAYGGFLGNNHPDRVMLAGSFTEADIPAGAARHEFGWVAFAPAPPLDLISDAVDDNGLLKNPKWTFQLSFPWSVPNPGDVCQRPDASCTSQQPTTDTAFLCSFSSGNTFGIDGHLNWFGVTYEGPVFWEGKSTEGTDDDYNISLIPPQGAGLTAASQGTIGLEFDSDETIDHFHTPFWERFHNAVDASDEQARQIIDGHDAIVTGLFGLDCPHNAIAEVHPVWAMAILIDDNPADQLWAIFVRNWGNEGFCGTQDHQINLQSYTFRLPWKEPAISLQVIPNETQFLTNSSQVTGPNVQFTPQQGVLVNFTLPPPAAHGRINGELHIRWQFSDVSPPPPPPPVSREAVEPRPAERSTFAELLGSMTAEQRDAVRTELRRAGSAGDEDELTPPRPQEAMAIGQLPALARPAASPVTDARREQAVRAVIDQVVDGRRPSQS
jgi:hypothetical protein